MPPFCRLRGVLKLLLIMKFVLLFLVMGTLQAHSKVFSQQKVSLTMKDAKMKKVLSAIEHVSPYRFIYADNILPKDLRINLSAREEPLTDLLDRVFSGTRLTYKILADSLIALGTTRQYLQDIRIRGKITDSTNGQPLIGVTVQIKGSNIGTTTGPDGTFSLDVPENAVLQISYVGYVPREMVAGKQSFLAIALSPTSTGLNQVVVIGYGSREKKDVTTSISTINADQISKSGTVSPEFAMQGRMPGVYVSGNTGSPLDRPTIQIRGVNTWGVSSPLYVIDGVPVTELGAGIEGQDARVADIRSPINIMSMISPDDIASISVLKDASAAAIYGVRAANGVVLITTKSGQKGKPRISFNARYGIQQVTKKWHTLNTQQYVNFYKQSYAANPAFVLDPWFDPSSSQYLGNTQQSYDWQTPLVNKNAPTQDYSLRVSGGSDHTDYDFSLGYNNTESSLLYQRLERYSVAMKVNSQVTPWLKVGVNNRLAYEQDNDNNGPDLSDLAMTPPWQPIYADGPDYLEGYAPVVVGYNNSGAWDNTKLYGDGTRINTYGMSALTYRHYNFVRDLGSTYVELDPVKGLKIKGSVNVDWFRQRRFEFLNYLSNYFSYTAGDPKQFGGGTSTGDYNIRDIVNFNLVKELSVTYDRDFGGHHINLLLDGMNQQFNASYVSPESQYNTTTDPSLLNLGGANQYTLVQSDRFRWALASVMGRLGYNYRSKYYLDFTVRRDGSSRFAPENRWGTFPAASAAWRLTSEPFLREVTWLNDLKFRIGWGKLGNQEVRPMAYVSAISDLPMFAFGSLPGGDGIGNYQTGAAMFSFPNPDLQWEKTTTSNIGFDAVLFNNLNLTAEYYHKLTDGILQETPIPPSVGSIENPVANIASVLNEGFEFSADYSGKLSKNWGFSVGGNFSTTRNKVLKTYEDIPFNTAVGRIEEGYPVNYIYGFKVGGMFQESKEAADYDNRVKDTYVSQDHQPGDLWFQDINGQPSKGHPFYTPGADSVIDNYDQTYLGSAIPKFFYGFNVGLTYKTFDFSAFFQGVGGVHKYSTVLMNLENTGTRGNNMITEVLQAWTPENTHTSIPRAVVNDPEANGRTSSRFVGNAAYLRFANTQLGYTLPKGLYHSLGGLENLRVYLSASNLFVITQWKGLDPENDNNPMPRVITFGISGRF